MSHPLIALPYQMFLSVLVIQYFMTKAKVTLYLDTHIKCFLISHVNISNGELLYLANKHHVFVLQNGNIVEDIPVITIQ